MNSDNNIITKCTKCNIKFGLFRWKHHCRLCGCFVCDYCSSRKLLLHPDQCVQYPGQSPCPTPKDNNISKVNDIMKTSVRVCDDCYTSEMDINQQRVKRLSEIHAHVDNKPIDHDSRSLFRASVLRFGLDIGGTLSKLVFHEPLDFTNKDPKEKERTLRAVEYLQSSDSYGESGIRNSSYDFKFSKGIFHFVKFATRHLPQVLEVTKTLDLLDEDDTLFCTGGGAFKYETLLEEELNVRLEKIDELDALVEGINFLLTNTPDQAFIIENFLFGEDPKMTTVDPPTTPYLIVNIGSGVSILHVKSSGAYERIGGTNLGGGTFLGLARALSNGEITSWKSALELAEEGKSHNVDMLVQDIYGGSYEALGLSGTHVASSFGKLGGNDLKQDMHYNIQDMVRSALLMLTNNIGSLAYLNAQLHNVDLIYFTGNFLDGNMFSKRTLAYAMNFWSKGKVQARFMKREGYFGALGTLVALI